MISKRIFCFLLFIPTLACAFKIYAPLRINSEIVQKYNHEVILDIYKSLGINAELIYVPEQEINERLKSGDFDAILSKISEEENIPNSIKIEPPLIENYSIYRWKLVNTPTNKTNIVVGSIKGVIAHTKSIIKNRNLFKKINYYHSYQALFDALKKGEVDSVLLSPIAIENEVPLLIKSQIEKIPGKLVTFNINHYIHRKHKVLNTKLSNEFIKRDKLKKLKYSDFLKSNK